MKSEFFLLVAHHKRDVMRLLQKESSMDRVKPYSGRSEKRLAGLIKAANPKLNRDDIDFEFGTPTAIAGWINTEVHVRPVVTSTVTDRDGCPCPHTVTPALFEKIAYRRMSLQDLRLLPACMILSVKNVSLPFSIHDILPQINEALGLDLLPTEVVNHRYENVAKTYKLEISSHHNLAWTKSYYMFEADIGINTNTRLLEDGSMRVSETGTPRVSEAS